MKVTKNINLKLSNYRKKNTPKPLVILGQIGIIAAALGATIVALPTVLPAGVVLAPVIISAGAISGSIGLAIRLFIPLFGKTEQEFNQNQEP